MRKFWVLMLAVVVLAGCGSGPEKECQEAVQPSQLKKEEGKNCFKDPVLREIYRLQDQRKSDGLYVFFKHENPRYREAAAMAFASIQDAAAAGQLGQLLGDTEKSVRIAAVYALGQLKNKAAEPVLINAFETETEPEIKKYILEALGRCGTPFALEFIVGRTEPGMPPQLLEGQAMGIYRAMLGSVHSEPGTARALSLTAVNMPERARFFAANYLSRISGIDLKKAAATLMDAFNNETELDTRCHLGRAMGKAQTPEVLAVMRKTLEAKVDYRLKVNLLMGLRGFEYKDVSGILYERLADSNVNVSVAAAETLQALGAPENAEDYFQKGKNIGHWRSRTLMLQAALQFAHRENVKLRKRIRDFINAAYKKTTHAYEQAALLTALAAGDVEDYLFLSNELFKHSGKVRGTSALGSLIRLAHQVKDDETQRKHFADIFQKVIQGDDATAAAIAAGVIRNPQMNFKNSFSDTAFIKDALSRCKPDGKIFLYEELRQANEYFNGPDESFAKAEPRHKPIDWDLVRSIAPDQKVKLKTAQGDIILRLMVEQAPASVANFLRLIEEGYYKGGVFHRVVPNFVIQGGCPRGDGTGEPGYSIRSEWARGHYTEGTLGMASGGKDTEGGQWFITHSSAPHLDGSYTIFGKVVSGMEAVHKMEVGDGVLEIAVL